MPSTTTLQLPPAVREYYERQLLTTLYPELVHAQFAQKKSLPKKNGDTVIFRRYSKLDTAIIPLVEGITPPGAQLSITDIKAQVEQYGNFVMITDWVEAIVEDKTINQATKLLGQNMGQSIDEIVRDVLKSTSSVLLCSHGSNGGTPTEIVQADIDAASLTLIGNDAKMITSVIKGTNQFSTTAIRPAFWGIMHSSLLDDLENVDSFVDTAHYPGDNKSILATEWGSTKNVRWCYSTIGSVSAATPAVYDNFIIAQEAYAVVALGGETGEFFVEQLGSAGTGDPLHQRGSVGWKHPFVARILNDNCIINLMATHS